MARWMGSNPFGLWLCRLSVAIDIARGLTYLHGQSMDPDSPDALRQPIYHRNIKVSRGGELYLLYLPSQSS